MRWHLPVLLVLAVLAAAGCVEPEVTTTTATAAPTLATTAVAANNYGHTPTPAPEPMAYISNIRCAVGDRSEAAYHCNGNVRIRSGGSGEAQVVARYADNNTFKSGSVALGGTEPVLKPFVIFPDLKYKDQTPKYFVRVDTTLYPVSWSGDYGTAWSNTPG